MDPGTWTPLHTLFNPADNVEGTSNVVDGLGKIAGKWAVIIGFDNKVMAGLACGQSENILSIPDHRPFLSHPGDCGDVDHRADPDLSIHCQIL